MSLARFGVNRPVAAGLLKVFLIVAGLVFGLGLRREFFPEISPTEVVVAAPYPGASPDEVEEALAIKIEDRLADLRDVKEISTTVTEGAAVLRVEFNEGVDIDVKTAEVKREVDALQDLPEQAERITITKFEPNIPAIILSIYGDVEERALKDAIQQVRDDLRSLPGMGDIRLSGVRRDELIVDVRAGSMLEHSVSLPEIADLIRRAMVELPGGSVRTTTETISIRTAGAQRRAEDVRSVVIRAGEGGQIVRLGEIADVRLGFVDAEVFTRVNGRPAASLTVFKVGRQDAVVMSEMVKAYVAGRQRVEFRPGVVERLRMRLGGGAGMDEPVSARHRAYLLGLSRQERVPGEFALTTDLARFITQRLGLLGRNAALGGFLVFLTLFLLLNWRAAFWVVIGLAAAILGTLVVMRAADITLNLLSMFGLIVVLGMLVDDGVVIAENIIRRHDEGEPALEAAVNGTDELTWPVVGTVVTTIFAFVPLLLIAGRIGDLLGTLPWVVACALGVSLVEALFALPVHMGHSLRRAEDRQAAGRVGPVARVEMRFDAARDRFFERRVIGVFSPLLSRALRRPYLFMSGVIAVLIASLGMVAGGRLPFTFFAAADSETIVGQLRMPIGTPVELTDAVVRRVEGAAMAQPEVQSIFAISGFQGDVEGGAQAVQAHLGQLFVELLPVEQRERRGMRTSSEVVVAIRNASGDLSGVKSLRLEEMQGGPGGAAITLTVVGERPERIGPVVARISRELAEFRGVYDIADDADAGQRELRLALRPGASELGFTTEWLARQVRGAVHGLEAFTFAGRREDIDVRVRLDERVRRSPAAVERMHVFSPAGRAVPLAEVAHVEEGRGYATLRRLNRQRAVTVSADVDSAIANTEEVMAALGPVLAAVQRENPGVRILRRGRQEDMADSFATLPLGMATAVGLNYAVLCILTGSYLQPLLIMAAIPFSIIGMIWGHIVLGYDLTMLSLIGFVALSGVVVNNAIVYMEFYNRGRRAGLSAIDAAHGAGVRRLRPILLTTITTVAGLGPLILEQSFQARILIPMAVTICGGLIASMILVLMALPCLLVMLDGAQRGLRGASVTE